jgi:hypothetical protein
MPSRYYLPNPLVQQPLEFLAGFLRGRQDVHAQELGVDAAQERQDQQLYAQGLSALGAPIFQAAQQRYGAQQASTRQQAAFQAAMQLAALRQQGDRWQDATQAYTAQWGPGAPEMPPAPFQGMPPGLQGAPPLPGFQIEGGRQMVGPPAPAGTPAGQAEAQFRPVQGGVPGPVIDPSSVPAYRTAQRRLAQLEDYKTTIDTNPHLSVEERANQLQTLAPHVAAATRAVSRFPAPKPPTNVGELVQRGDVIPLPGYDNVLMRQEDGSYKASPALKKRSPTGTAPTYVGPDGQTHEMKFGANPYGDDGILIWDGKDNVKYQKIENDSLVDAFMKAAVKPDSFGKILASDPEAVREALSGIYEVKEATRLFSNIETIKGRIGDGSITRREANQFTADVADMFGAKTQAEREKIPASAQRIIQAVWVDSMKNEPPRELAGPPAPERAAPAQAPLVAPVSETVQRLRGMRPEVTAQQETAERQRASEAAIQRRAAREAERKPVQFELMAIQNQRAGPEDNVSVVRPDGRVVVLKRRMLTKEEMERLERAGFQIPGLRPDRY